MAFEAIMRAAQKHNVALEALAALGARLRADSEPLDLDPELAPLIERVVVAMGFDAATLASLDQAQRQAAAGMIRSFFRQAAEMLEQPDRPPGWAYDDPAILQSQGRGSRALVPIIQQIAPTLGDLAQRLQDPGGAFLDVGTGAGWLAMGMAAAYPRLAVVGIDIWKPALDLAAVNCATLSERVTLREQDVAQLRDEERYDAVFLPGPFLPRPVVATAVERARLALRHGGWLLFGLYAPIDDPLSASLTDLRTVRSGGHPWAAGEVVALMDAAGLTATRAFERDWQMPMTFVAGMRPD